MRGFAVTRDQSSRPISRPVASRACSTRLTLCAASRASAGAPSASRSNAAPHASSSTTYLGPSRTSTSTAAGSHRPSPAAIVSRACSSGESSASERRRNAALCVAGVALAWIGLGENDDVA